MMDKKSFTGLYDSKIYNRLTKESKKQGLSKVKIVSIALSRLFKEKNLDLKLD